MTEPVAPAENDAPTPATAPSSSSAAELASKEGLGKSRGSTGAGPTTTGPSTRSAPRGHSRAYGQWGAALAPYQQATGVWGAYGALARNNKEHLKLVKELRAEIADLRATAAGEREQMAHRRLVAPIRGPAGRAVVGAGGA